MDGRRRFAVGEMVVPMDLPRVFVCAVVSTHPVGVCGEQLLALEALDGPWPPGTQLVRLDETVRRARTAEIGSAVRVPPSRGRRRRAARSRHLTLGRWRTPTAALASPTRCS